MGTTRSVEVSLVESVSKRRYRSKQERRAVVEETLRPGASVAVIARRHGVNANQVFHWRKRNILYFRKLAGNGELDRI
jgi:transposase-like protein